uniref:glucuronosyltransferase n=1 Tax=Pristionchus pacificus TaxID=54126 RepID=A0A8R1YAJ5_PRIPA
MGWPLCILRENAEDMIQTEREEQESEECTFLISSTKERSESIIESVVKNVFIAIFLTVIILLAALDSYGIDGVVPLIQEHFNINGAETAMIQTTTSVVRTVTFALMCIFGGVFERSYFFGKLYMTAVAFWIIMSLLSIVLGSASFMIFVVIRSLAASGYAVFHVLNRSLGVALMCMTAFDIVSGFTISAIFSSFIISGSYPWQAGLIPWPLIALIPLAGIACLIEKDSNHQISLKNAILTDSFKMFSNCFIDRCLVFEWLRFLASVNDFDITALNSIVALAGNFIGMPFVLWIAQSWHYGTGFCLGRSNAKAYPIVVMVGCFLNFIMIILDMITIKKSFIVRMIPMFISAVSASPETCLFPLMTMMVLPKNSRAAALSLGRFIGGIVSIPSAQIIGFISDKIRGDSTHETDRFHSYQLAMISFSVVLFVSVFCYGVAVLCFERDCKETEDEENNENLEEEADECTSLIGSTKERSESIIKTKQSKYTYQFTIGTSSVYKRKVDWPKKINQFKAEIKKIEEIIEKISKRITLPFSHSNFELFTTFALCQFSIRPVLITQRRAYKSQKWELQSFAMQVARVIVVLQWLVLIHSYKILVFRPRHSQSINNFLGNIADTLVDAGHNVTTIIPIINPLLRDGTFKSNKIYIEMTDEVRKMTESINFHEQNIYDFDDYDIYGALSFGDYFCKWISAQCKGVLDEPGLMDRLIEEKYDVMFVENFETCGVALSHLIKPRSLITSSSSFPLAYEYDEFGMGSALSYNPSWMISHLNVNSIIIRFWNLYAEVIFLLTWYESRNQITQIFQERYGANYPSITPLIDYATPTLNRIHYIGGIGTREPKQLDEELDRLFTLRKKTVLMSFGSVTMANRIPLEVKHNIVKTFARFPDVTFLWKYEKPDNEFAKSALTSTPNLHMLSWTPQNDLLADDRLTAFITHSGMASTMETALRGKPGLFVPMMGDQFRNAGMMEKKWTGKIFRQAQLAVKDLLENESYRENAKRMAAMMKKKPFSAKETMIKYVEFADEFGPSPSLRPSSYDMTWIAYYNADILLAAIVILLFFTFVTFKMSRCLLNAVIPVLKRKLD